MSVVEFSNDVYRISELISIIKVKEDMTFTEARIFLMNQLSDWSQTYDKTLEDIEDVMRTMVEVIDNCEVNDIHDDNFVVLIEPCIDKCVIIYNSYYDKS